MDDILGEKIICTNQMLYVLKLCLDWYDGEPCGGDLHVVLDDDNTDDESIDYCYNYTDREDAKKIMEELKKIPEDERIWVTYNIQNTKLDILGRIDVTTLREVFKETE